MLPQPVVLGYHGCTRALARRVVSDEIPLRPSENDYDWLGHGIYFWATDASRAMVWAQSRVSELGPVAADPVVLGAAIELGNCLQLADVRAVAYLREAYKELKLASDQENVQLPRNTGKFFSNRKLDCAVFEALHQLRAKRNLAPFDTVAAYFVEGDEIYPGAAIRALDHVQICVRNPEKILGYFLARTR